MRLPSTIPTPDSRRRNSADLGGVQTCMAKSVYVPLGLLVAMLSGVCAQAQHETQQQTKKIALWAAITVQHPIFSEGSTDALQINFGVYNDGPSTVNPEIDSSHLLINGVEPKDWRNVVINGLRTPQFDSLPPGELLAFGKVLGMYFRRPGVYRVRWEGDNFKTAELTFRVVPGHR